MTDPIDPNGPYSPPGGYGPPGDPGYPQPSYPPPSYPPPSYPPQTYPPQSYPAPTYPPPTYPPQEAWPFGYPPLPAPPPIRRRGRWPYFLVGAAVLAIASALLIGLLTAHGTHRLAAPETIGDYHRIRGAEADRIEKTERSLAGNGNFGSFADAVTIASYGENTGDVPTLVTLVAPRSSGPSGTDDEVINQIFTGITSPVTGYPPGSHGGALSCSSISVVSVHETLCAWVDDKSIGLVIAINSSHTADDIAATANTLRGLTEH